MSQDPKKMILGKINASIPQGVIQNLVIIILQIILHNHRVEPQSLKTDLENKNKHIFSLTIKPDVVATKLLNSFDLKGFSDMFLSKL